MNKTAPKRISRRPDPFTTASPKLPSSGKREARRDNTAPPSRGQSFQHSSRPQSSSGNNTRSAVGYSVNLPRTEPTETTPPRQSVEDNNQQPAIGKVVIWVITILCIFGAAWVYRFELVNLLRIFGHSLAWAGIAAILVILCCVTFLAVRSLLKRGLKRLALFFAVFFLIANGYLFLNMLAAPICDHDIDAALKNMPSPGQRVIYARRGEGYERLALPLDRRVSADELRESALILAVPPIEDERFWTRVTGPLDPEAILRAAVQTLVLRKKQGGSTILVQTAKLIQGKLKSTWLDKPYQFLMALRLSQRFPTGEEQLAFYLNLADLDGPYGVAYAASDFFGVADLREFRATEPEGILGSATLAGMLRAPNDYHPRLHPQEALSRRNVVLSKMHEVGVVQDLNALQAQPLKVREMARTRDRSFFARAIKGSKV